MKSVKSGVFGKHIVMIPSDGTDIYIYILKNFMDKYNKF